MTIDETSRKYPHLKRIVFLLLLAVYPYTLSYSQTRTIKNYYQNGQLESKGKMYFFSNFDKRIPKKYEYFTGFKKKHGEWKYWYPNGKIARIENYILDKNILKADDLPHGKWTYYNEDGIKYKEEIYSLGSLMEYERPIYYKSIQIGKITSVNGIRDTLLFNGIPESNNLVLNGNFELYFYQPINITYLGKSRIEEWVPFWNTPGSQTPDYISNLRQIEFLDYPNLFTLILPEEYNYVGLALYNCDLEYYSEYIQGQLVTPLSEGKAYCIRISINTTLFSGFKVNSLGIHLSPTSFRSVIPSKHIPQIMLGPLPEEANEFEDICATYIATGGEKTITIGRYTNLRQTTITPVRKPIPTRFGLNSAAYYLINQIEVFEIENDSDCICKRLISIPDTAISHVAVKEAIESEFENLRGGNIVVIRNLLFDFDSYELKERSDSTLIELLKFLNDNPDISISIEGHTDDQGSQEYNLILSENRAKSVYLWLINKGIESDRLSFKGFGKQNPIVPPISEKDREMNRRVEVRIIN